MITSEVRRTLVKSPPELWAELSDPSALARHLGELGEIRIVKTNPEQSVEWEAEDVKGRVELQPSGWGTKVTLAITREMHESAQAQDAASAEPEEQRADSAIEASAEPEEQQADSAVEASAEPEEQQADPPAEASAEPEPEVEPETTPEPETAPETAPEPKLGFFARLFRRRAKMPKPAPEQEIAPEHEVARDHEVAPPDHEIASEHKIAPEPQIASAAKAEPNAPPACQVEPEQPSNDLAAELAAAEEAIVAQTTELLSAVLDRLGSAHHRPFSRA